MWIQHALVTLNKITPDTDLPTVYRIVRENMGTETELTRLSAFACELLDRTDLTVACKLYGVFAVYYDVRAQYEAVVLAARMALKRVAHTDAMQSTMREIFRTLRDVYRAYGVRLPDDFYAPVLYDPSVVYAGRALSDTHCCDTPDMLATLRAHNGAKLDEMQAAGMLWSSDVCNQDASDVARALTSVRGGVSQLDAEAAELMQRLSETPELISVLNAYPEEMTRMLAVYKR